MICIYGKANNSLLKCTIEKVLNMMIIYKNGDNGIVNIMKDVPNNWKKHRIIVGEEFREFKWMSFFLNIEKAKYYDYLFDLYFQYFQFFKILYIFLFFKLLFL